MPDGLANEIPPLQIALLIRYIVLVLLIDDADETGVLNIVGGRTNPDLPLFANRGNMNRRSDIDSLPVAGEPFDFDLCVTNPCQSKGLDARLDREETTIVRGFGGICEILGDDTTDAVTILGIEEEGTGSKS